MPDEASITIVTRMRDEASTKMQAMTKTIEAQAFSAQQLQTTLTATGSALAAVGSLMGQMESPTAKIASKFMITAGAIMSTTSAIMAALPMIRSLINTLRTLAIVQTLVSALSGPAGWARIGIGMGIAAGAIGGIYAMTRSARGTPDAGGVQVVNFNSQAFTGSRSDARKFSRQMQTISREETRLGR